MHPNETRAKTFRALHSPGRPLILFNAWDAGSAKAVTDAGARAIATGSWSVAASHGLEDGEKLPLHQVIANLDRIVRATDLPVSVDIESGYGETFCEVGQAISRTIEAGAIGCNMEDSLPGTTTLRAAHDMADRIGWARRAANAAGIPYFINARTDVFFQATPDAHDRAMLDEAVARGRIYAESGADGLFVPGLVDRELMRELAAQSPLPVNVMMVDGSPDLQKIAAAGIARISHGPGPYLLAMRALGDAAATAFESQAG